jgi:hypothetical protein
MERYVTQVPQSAKEKVAAGKMEVTTALEVATTPAPLRDKVVEVAQEIADAEQAAEPAPKQKRKRKPIDRANGAAAQQLAVDINKERQVSAPVKTKHVRAAQRVVAGAMPRLKAPKLTEAVSVFVQWATDTTLPVQMTAFAIAFANWAHGKLADTKLTAAWRAVADALAWPDTATRSSGKTVTATTKVPKRKKSVKAKHTKRTKQTAKVVVAKQKK